MTNEEANSVIKKYIRYITTISMRMGQPEYIDDMIQIGRMAAIDAYGRLDPTKIVNDEKSYITTCIKGAIKNFLSENARTIRIPNKRINDVSISTISLNTPINDDGDTIEDLIQSDHTDIYPEQNEAIKSLYLALSQLKPKHQLMIKMYYDLNDDDQPMTLQSIGDELGITKEAVRQQLSKAYEKLKIKLKNEKI